MPPIVATFICWGAVAGLFWLNRTPEVKTSIALWIPTLWVALACSRSVSQWLNMSPPVDTAAQVLEGSPLDRNVYMLLIAIGVFVLVFRAKRIFGFLWANGPILLFLFYCATSLMWSDFPDIAFKRWIKAVGDLVMVLIILSDPNPLPAFKRFLTRVGYVLVPPSILFIKYYPALGMEFSPWGGKGTYTGVTTNKNTLGVVCLLFGLGALWRLVIDYKNKELPNRSRVLAAQGIFLSMVFWLFWVSNSMTSLNSFLMAGILLIVANSRLAIRRPSIVTVLALTMLTFAASVVFLNISPDLLRAMGRNPTLTDRTEVWGILRGLVANPVIGTGYESFWLGPRLERLWEIYWWHPNEAHNGYLEVFLQLGWIGIALLVFVILAAYRTVFRLWRRDPQMGSICLAFFYVGLVYNFTEAAFFKILAPAWIFFLLATTKTPVPQAEFAEEILPGRSGPPVREQARPAFGPLDRPFLPHNMNK